MKLISNINLLTSFPLWRELPFSNICEFSDFPMNLDGSEEESTLVLDLSKICNTNEFSSYLELIRSYLSHKSKAKTLVTFSSFKGNFIQTLNTFPLYNNNLLEFQSFIREILSGSNHNINYINLENLSDWCFEKDISDKNWYESRCSLSLIGLKKLTLVLKKFLRYKVEPVKKVIVLDCDNTLWGGVVGEDGLSGLMLSNTGIGEVYQDIQKFMLECRRNGFLLCLASKNNEKDVLDVFRNHQEMILTLDDIVDYRINWVSKAQNIKELSLSLNLGLDSFIFVDDNPIERLDVRSNLPEVTVLDLPDLIHQWLSFFRSQNCFFRSSYISQGSDKTLEYKKRADFIKESNARSDKFDFLRNINLKAEFLLVDDYNLQRASELTVKTNQFNLNKIPREPFEITELSRHPDRTVKLVSLKDKFNDHGIIGLISFIEVKNKLVIDTFILSCRILGRFLEQWILSELLKNYSVRRIDILYKETEKNLMLRNIFNQLQFEFCCENNICFFTIEVDKLEKNLKFSSCYE